MVSVEEVVDEQQPPKAGVDNATAATPLSASEERMLDAAEIESVLVQLKRPTAKMRLESLVKKLRKESAALKVVEASSATNNNDGTKATTTATTTSPPAPSSAPKPAATAPPSKPGPPGPVASHQYTTIDPFSFDAGGSMDQYVSIYLPLPGVGSIPKSNIDCQFGADKFDIKIVDLKGKNYRLKKDNLEHDIVAHKSKFVVKANKIILKLAKVKGEYGSYYDFWSKLTDPRKKEKAANKKVNADNPLAGINDLMRDMYENGDEKTRKMIGETMLKQRNGELGKDGGMGGMGGMGGFGDGDDDLGGLGGLGDDDEDDE